MQLVPAKLPPGIFRAGTEYSSKGRWYDSSLVRFFANSIQPVGGWVRANNAAQFTGRPCGMLAWRPNATDVQQWLAVGTHTNLYAFDGSDVTDITPSGFTTGRADAIAGLGYGAGQYGTSDYGTVRPFDGRTSDATSWSLDNWGEYLVGCSTSDGRLFEWQLNILNDAAVITNAPINNVGLFATSERMLVALGAGGDVRKVQWSNQEDNTTWTPTATNTAGDFLLSTDGRIITGCRTRSTHLIWTDVDLHTMTYSGSPFWYSFERVGSGCGIIAPNAKAVLDNKVVWMSPAGFFAYDGFVQPIPCDVWEYIIGDLNEIQRSKITAGVLGEFGEVWWFYPSSGSTENDRYVVWNHRENHWTIGQLERTCWVDQGTFSFPFACDASGWLYQHENGWTDNGAERGSAVFLQSGPFELTPGTQMAWINQVVHDESDASNLTRLTINTRFTPEGTEYTAGPYSLNSASGYTDVRAQGRQFSMLIEEVTSGGWRLGEFRFDVRTGGKR